MEARLRLLEHLYGEVQDSGELAELLVDPVLREEYRSMENVRHLLDSGMGREHPGPPAEALDRIMRSVVRRPRRIYFGPVRRRRRVVAMAGAMATVTMVLTILIWTGLSDKEPLVLDSVVNQSESVGLDPPLTWDDTDDFIKMRQTLSVVRQRTSPRLWDESAVMSLESFPEHPAQMILGLKSVSTNPHNP